MKTLSLTTAYFFRKGETALPIVCLCIVATASDDQRMLKGVVHLHKSLVGSISPNDRLVFKLFHPQDGIEKDLTYRFFRSPSFPFSFEVGPNIDMSKRTKWRSYVIEVSIDQDKNPSEVSASEPSATSDALVPLGASGLDLLLQLK